MEITVQQIIDYLIKPIGLLEQTVDTLLFGSPQQKITGIVTTFMPTQYVLESARKMDANMIIAHEGPFYKHQPLIDPLIQEDPILRAKKELIEDADIAIFRFHDYIHRYEPDGIIMGLIDALKWNDYVVKHEYAYSIVQIDPMPLVEVSYYIKRKLHINYVRAVGQIDTSCSRIGIMVGYRGAGQHVIPVMEKENLDLVIYGEGPEWETPEYIRDASWQGYNKALIALGHAESEEPGMKRLAEQIGRDFPQIPVHFIANEPLFQLL